MKLPGKILFILLLLFFSLFLLPKYTSLTVLAQGINPQDILENNTLESLNQQSREANAKAIEEGKPVIYAGGVAKHDIAVKAKAIADMIGCTDPDNCNEKQTALYNLASVISSMYAYPPASGLVYTYDLFANAGFVDKAYAQGIGFSGLSPMLPLWKTSRNIAYSVIILVMVVIGFMIIFRMKIDPKTVISLQAALPKIVITLILITLSYPIVGFMVDVMYLSIAIVVSLLTSGMGQAARASEVQSYFLTSHMGDLFKSVFGIGFSTLDDFIKSIWGGYSVGSAGVFTAIKIFGGLNFLQSFGLGVSLIGLLFILILFLGLLFTFIRLFLLLLNSYIQLLITLVLGPLALLLEAVPGKSAFSQWILNVLANLVVFPATVAVLLFAQYLTQINLKTQIITPPLIGLPWSSQMPGVQAFPAFMGLGVIFLAPTLVAQIKKALRPKPILPISAGTAFAPLTGGVQTTMGAASQFYYLQQMPFLKNLMGQKGGGTH